MCGICGFSGEGDSFVVERMLNAMPYRGPDGSGVWHDQIETFFGHLRLSIVDLEGGRQPLESVDGQLAITFNGEIYNHRELRRELEHLGHQFVTDHSDTEVLLYGYREWGEKLTSRLNGMWAFAIYDKPRQRIWISRDRFGKKPIFYALNGDTFAFSSELSSLIQHPRISAEVDETSLMKYFGYGYVPAPRSLIKGVKKLPAGHSLVYDLVKKVCRVNRYWRFESDPAGQEALSTEQYTTQLIEKLYQAVDLRMQADVPVGVFLSGGVDSSAVIALAISAEKGIPVKTFSIGFEEVSFDETGYSQEVSDLLGSEHTVQNLSVDRCLGLVDTVYGRLDEPIADSSLVPSFLMCELASQHVTVALGGDGSDEIFAGYDPFRALRPAALYSKLMPSLGHEFLSAIVNRLPVSHRNMSLDFRLKKTLEGLGFSAHLWNPIWLGCLSPSQLTEVFGQRIDPTDLYSEAIDAWEASTEENYIDRTIQFYVELYLQNGILTKMDRAGMLNSLEVRSPFLDKSFIDLVRRIPSDFKFNGKETKFILKESLKKVLPDGILYRKKKGFGMPIGKWFHEQKLEINPSRISNWIDPRAVTELSSGHVQGSIDRRAFLWAHYVMERWLDNLQSFSKS